jgi:hypothetical protein
MISIDIAGDHRLGRRRPRRLRPPALIMGALAVIENSLKDTM